MANMIINLMNLNNENGLNNNNYDEPYKKQICLNMEIFIM